MFVMLIQQLQKVYNLGLVTLYSLLIYTLWRETAADTFYCCQKSKVYKFVFNCFLQNFCKERTHSDPLWPTLNHSDPLLFLLTTSGAAGLYIFIHRYARTGLFLLFSHSAKPIVAKWKKECSNRSVCGEFDNKFGIHMRANDQHKSSEVFLTVEAKHQTGAAIEYSVVSTLTGN